MSEAYLVVDCRERAVIPFLESIVTDYELVVSQISVGDYLICRKEGGSVKTLACIERKTLEDFASSFRDGRYVNFEKMSRFRAGTGCKLFLVIEGPAFPARSRCFSRIPYKNILAAIDAQMVANDVFVVYSADQQHTAQRLADLLHTYNTHAARITNEPPVNPETSGETSGTAAGDADTATGDADTATGDADTSESVTSESVAAADGTSESGTSEGVTSGGVTGLVPDTRGYEAVVSDSDHVAAMWKALPYVSITIGKMLATKISIAGVFDEPEAFAGLKTLTGRALQRKTIKSLQGLQGGDGDLATQLLAGVRGISAATAAALLRAAGGLRELCRLEIAELALVRIPQKNRVVAFGAAKAALLHRLLWHTG